MFEGTVFSLASSLMILVGRLVGEIIENEKMK